jgi:hypothetical protein
MTFLPLRFGIVVQRADAYRGAGTPSSNRIANF